MAAETGDVAGSFMPNAARRKKLRKIRAINDVFAGILVGIGGVGVIIALALIFVYLFSEVAPLFRSAQIDEINTYAAPGKTSAQRTYWLTLERYDEIAGRFTDDGRVTYFNAVNGQFIKQVDLAVPEGVEITSFAIGEPKPQMFVYGLSNGSVIVGKHDYDITYPDGNREIDPKVSYPLGEKPLVLDDQGIGLAAVAVQKAGDGAGVAAITRDGRILLTVYEAQTSFMSGEVEITPKSYELPGLVADPLRLLISSNMNNLMIAQKNGELSYYDISQPDQAGLVETERVVPEGAELTAIEYLLGTVSMIVGDSDGRLAQWMLVRDDQNIYHIEHVRDFDQQSARITFIQPEYTRKGFLVGDAAGNVSVHFATSARSLALENLSDEPITALGISPVNTRLLVADKDNQVTVASLWNEHPQVSFSALWGEVQYEGRGTEEYIWQASSGTDEFEPKFSLIPLTVGTLKAALFAMLFAMPIAVLGAVYSAYFMTPKMRSTVKPTIEVMEALPTVVLGFLAGLWLAPFMELHLPAVFSIVLLMPLSFILCAYGWQHLPAAIRIRIPDGWEAALLIPVVFLVGGFCVFLSPFIELWFFNGSMRQWLTDVGINYDQRNAMVVGIAMGFAVIPTIFSIAEDAVFNVPKHLTQGSLALGATSWQTVTRVVLLTASPGIFSAIMIGFGRAVGETMIVIMATGNSPVVNFNIFEGMRTLSANIAVELPETEVGATHFRILFLAALVLFAMTFVLNTIAEVVRQRLRERYSSL
ncbi:MAG: ABC transporter permease subunit [Gammaproteobacteria bacterium]